MTRKTYIKPYDRVVNWGSGTAGTVAAAPFTDEHSSEVFIQADKANAGTLYIGFGTTLTTIFSAIQLTAGDWATLPINNPALIFIVGNDASEVFNHMVFD